MPYRIGLTVNKFDGVSTRKHYLILRNWYTMDKTHCILITLSITIGVLFAWVMGYTEWWQWLLSIIVTGIIVYLIVGIVMAIVTIIAIISLYKYWQNNKNEIKFNLYVLWERLWRPFTHIEEIKEYVRTKYKISESRTEQ